MAAEDLEARVAEWERLDWLGGGGGGGGGDGHGGAPAAAAELEDAFCGRLAFGTAGLRGLTGPGFNRMNHVTVVQTTQGLCRYLERTCPEQLAAGGVAIGFDGRHRSDEFARLAASVCVARGVPVHLFARMVPTPLLATCVAEKGAAAGIMVTASHNPKEYNGYKVYWGNGCQIVPPHDAGIAACIEEELPIGPLPDPAGSPLVADPEAEVGAAYLSAVADSVCFFPGRFRAAAPVVYTPLHGVGLRWVEAAFEACGLPAPVPVAEQAAPDPEFPTVRFPNPEEGAGVWDLAIATAERAGARLCVANDPDADRLALCERQPDGAWRSFTGNEIGALLGDWILRHGVPEGERARTCFLASTVSSKMLGAVAEAEGFRFEETLTGFKWLGNRALELAAEGCAVPFAFEEAIGFMFGHLNDKDGVAGACAAAEMAAALAAEGSSLAGRLAELHAAYGCFVGRQGYFLADAPAKTAAVFARIRAEGYPETIGGLRVVGVRDLGTGLDTGKPGGRTDLHWAPGDLMVTYTLEGGGTLTIRVSGTEPKLKYYLEVSAADEAAAAEKADRLLAAVESEVVRPREHDLQGGV